MQCQPGTQIRYTALPTKRYPDGASPSEITRHSMDASYQLQIYLDTFKRLYGDAVSSGAMTTGLATKSILIFCFLAVKYCSLLLLPATPSSPSWTLEGLFEQT